ncbi:hypothetical protein BV898_09150 [Hypsibius exemplaris]|uniref:Termicin n=1 Tax=Hypsibius exemplaris TaxID=2072580 RepID=A0A1W0WNK4_HYPEX|nr:hypothetical protein BV898_09150 [Hypsibius exemplaris]
MQQSVKFLLVGALLVLQFLPSQVDSAMFIFEYTCPSHINNCHRQCKTEAGNTQGELESCNYDRSDKICVCATKPYSTGPNSAIG